MKLTRYLTAAALVAGLGACSATPASQVQTIATMEQALTVADDALLVYFALPVCGAAGASSICKTTAIEANAKTASASAVQVLSAAMTSAQAGTAVDLTAANAALAALQTIVASVPKL